MKVYASIPKLEVTAKGLEKSKEIYTLCIASDLAAAADRPAALGASNETLEKVAPEVQGAMKFFVASASNVFHRIRADQPVSLTGSGVILYPPSDPKGMLALHVVVVESDRGKRKLGRVIEEIFADEEVKANTGKIAEFVGSSASVPAALMTRTFGLLVDVIPAVLKNNDDDVMFAHSHSGFDFDDYGATEDRTDQAVGNDRCSLTLRVRTIP